MMKQRDITTWLTYVIFGAITLVLFSPLIFDHSLFWRLPSLQFYPWRSFAFDEIRAGRLPYWNPYLGGGTPLAANYQSAVFYPPNWFHLFLPDARAMTLIALFHVFWAGTGMWQFTRKLGFAPLARGVSMLCFALGSYSLGHLGNFALASTAAWMPWLFWATWRVMDRRRMRDVGILSMISGMLLLAGHAQTAWYEFLALGLFALWYVTWTLRSSGRRAQVAALLFSATAIILGVGIAGFQILMTLELLGESHRAGGVDFETLTEYSYVPWRFTSLVAPMLFGHPADGSYLATGNDSFFENSIYIGFLPLVSVVFAITGWLERRKFMAHHIVFRSVPLWLIITIIGYVLAMGRYTPLYEVFFNYVPTFDAFRAPVRWLIWPAFGLSVLAGIGIHNWSNSQRALFWTRLTTVGGISALVAVGISISLLDISDDIRNYLLRSMVIVGCWAAGSAILGHLQPAGLNASMVRWQMLVLLFIGIDLGWAGGDMNSFVPNTFYERDFSVSRPVGRLYWFEDHMEAVRDDEYFVLHDYRQATERWAEVRTSLLPNLNVIDQIPLFNNYDPLQPAVHREYVELIEVAGPSAGPLLTGAGVGQTMGPVQPDDWEMRESNTFVTEEEPRTVWMVPAAIWLEEDANVAGYLSDPDWSAEELVILQRGEAAPEHTEAVYTESSVITTIELPNERHYRVVSDGAGYLVVANTWYPGWSVTVDGEEAQLYQANVAFQAVAIPEGGGDVVFSYTPTTAGPGFLLSAVSIFAALLLTALGLFRYE